MSRVECTVCGWVYKIADGDPETGIAPGTRFEDIPDDWTCPVCGATKDQFVPLEEVTIEQAIRTAIAYETRVRDLYDSGKDMVTDATARRVLEVLCREENWHLEYLNRCLAEWERTGRVSSEPLSTAVPPRTVIEAAISGLRQRLQGAKGTRPDAELDLLKRALAVEIDTSDFYRQLVASLAGEAQALFQRFLEIEQGHQALVAAQIDSVTGLGFWFDTREFDLEAG